MNVVQPGAPPLLRAPEKWIRRWNVGGSHWLVKVVAAEGAHATTITGYVTCARAVINKTPKEIEKTLGLHEGTLRHGAAILIPAVVPSSTEDFEYRLTALLPGGKTYKGGSYFPPGLGAHQWELKKPLPVAFAVYVEAGEKLNLDPALLKQKALFSSLRRPLNGAVSGEFSRHAPFPIYAATRLGPSGRECNRIRLTLDPVACWRMNQVQFPGGGTYLRPETKSAFTDLRLIVSRHPDSPLSIFGHDAGAKDGNARLRAGLRAEVVYGLLTRNTELWERRFQEKDWDWSVLRMMLNKVSLSLGRHNTEVDLRSVESIRRVQYMSGLQPTGSLDRETRVELYRLYMDFLADPDFEIPPTRFLGKGTAKGARGAYQSCGSNNPVVVYSAKLHEEVKNLSSAEPLADSLYALNRRVSVILFRPGTEVNPASWRCPLISESDDGCRRRFWSDAQSRLAPGDATRWHESGEKTFACRLYERLNAGSPCEMATLNRILRIFLQDEKGRPITDEPYSLQIDGEEVTDANSRTNAQGVISHSIELSAASAVLWVGTHRWQIRLREMNPHFEKYGSLSRLANLGVYVEHNSGPLENERRHFGGRTLIDLTISANASEHEDTLPSVIEIAHRILP